MAIHTPRTREQHWFLENVNRARASGVNTKTCDAIFFALLRGNTAVQFKNNSTPVSITDEYLIHLQDTLADKAIEEKCYDDIKWVGFPK